MSEVFEDRDLSDAVFWGVDLSGALLRDVDLSGVRVFHAALTNLDIDGVVDHVVINGVDVTDYVNEHDRWYPLRAMIRPPDPAGMRTAWAELERTWEATIERARTLGEAKLNESVAGEWSFIQTLRHLVFAMDKWFTVPILGEKSFHPIGLSNTGSVDFGWTGVDPDANPTLDEALDARADRASKFRTFLEDVTADDLTRVIEIMENGPVPMNECIYTVFEEEFEHDRYAERDLAQLR